MVANLKLYFISLNFSPVRSYSRLSAFIPRLQSNGQYEKDILQGIKYFRTRRVSDFGNSYAFTIDKETAAKIANTVMSSVLKRKDATVIEINPGPGLISQELFKSGLQKLIVYDSLNCPYFMKWFKDNSQRVSLRYDKILKRNGLFISHFSSAIKDNHCKIIISLPHRLFFRRLFYHIVFNEWNLCEGVDFYLILSPNILMCLRKSNLNYLSVIDYGLCFILFDIQILDEFKRYNFLPKSKSEGQNLHFVHIMKKDKPMLTQSEAKSFLYFLLLVVPRKSQLLLQALENWFPGIGPFAIARGIKATSHVRELNGDELVKIFLMIKNLKYNLEIFNHLIEEL